MAELAGCDLLSLWDSRRAWYHFGVPGWGEDIRTLADNIKTFAKSYKTVILAGASMGGYAALLVSSLIKAQRVIALNPQSFISANARIFHQEKRWPWQNDFTPLLSNPDLLDLRTQKLNPDTEYLVFSDINFEPDLRHLSELPDSPRLHRLLINAGNGHGVGRKVARENWFIDFISTGNLQPLSVRIEQDLHYADNLRFDHCKVAQAKRIIAQHASLNNKDEINMRFKEMKQAFKGRLSDYFHKDKDGVVWVKRDFIELSLHENRY